MLYNWEISHPSSPLNLWEPLRIFCPRPHTNTHTHIDMAICFLSEIKIEIDCETRTGYTIDVIVFDKIKICDVFGVSFATALFTQDNSNRPRRSLIGTDPDHSCGCWERGGGDDLIVREPRALLSLVRRVVIYCESRDIVAVCILF